MAPEDTTTKPNFAEGIPAYVKAIQDSLAHLAKPADLTLPQRRDRFDLIGDLLKEAYPDGMQVRNTYIALPGREVPIRIYSPDAPAPRACIIYFHGGGYVSGSIDSHDAITAHLAEITNCTVVSVHYRRPPENPFPAPNDDCYEAAKWVAANHEQIGIAPDRLVLAGDSAGGNLAASCALRANEEGDLRIRGQVLIYPGMCADTQTTESYRTNRNDPFLAVSSMQFYRQSYLGAIDPNSNPYAAPLHASDLSGMPPAYILVAEHDPVRDDGVIFHKRLVSAGVKSELRNVEGMIHGFLRARRFSKLADKEFARLGSAVTSMVA